jgi:hypothetical protein
VAAALLGLSALGFGQATDANLVGTVVDATAAAVPNTSIELTNTATGVKTTTKTDSSGLYRFNNLPVGQYDLKAAAAGFASATLKGLDLQLNKNATANLILQVGSVSASVDVTEAVATIDTTTAQLQSSFEANQIVNLPIVENSQNFYGALNLSLLSAGVASNGGVGQGIGPSVGGQRPMENNFTIEGVDNNNKALTGPLVYVPTDATAEFTLMTNQYNAEFGHSTGGQFNTVIKSGTNQFHGSLYEYFQNRNLNALDAILANQGFTTSPRFDQNKLGVTFGGAIIKDKLFYFGSLEYAPLGQAFTATPISSPTAAGYAQLGKLTGISSANLKALQQYLPTAPVAEDSTPVCPGVTSDVCSDPKAAVANRVAVPIGTLPIAGAFYNNFYSGLGSINYNPSEKDQIRGRFIYNKSTSLDNTAFLPAFWTPLPQKWYLATLSEIHSFSPSLTSETRLGFNRFSQYYTVPNFNFPGLDTFPTFDFDDLGISVGPGAGPQFTVLNTYQLVENLNWTKGKHSFKFGFDGRDSISPQFFVQRVRGEYEYSDLNEYLNDQVPANLAERNLGNTPYYGNQWATYLYGTDQWRVKNNLTVSLGLRWERTTVPETELLQNLNALANVPGLLVFNSPKTSNKNFAPRIGIAWSPGHRGTTSVRAGFGLGYDVIYDNVGTTSYPPQLSPTIDAGNDPAKYHAPFLADGAIGTHDVVVGNNLTAAQARAQTSSYLPDQKLPYAIQWNVGVQHVFHNDYTLEVRYLGTRGVHLLVQQQINKTNAPVTPSQGLPTYLQAPSQATLDSLPLTLAQLQGISAIPPAFRAAGFTSNITAFMPIGNSLYHGLATQLTRRFAHGLQFIGAYTWSHNIDDSTASHFSTVLTPRREMDFGNLRLDRATSALDRRQRLTASWLWEAPWKSHSSNWAAKNLLGNWRFVGTYTAETGELATAQSIQDSNLNGDSAGDRTVINPAGNPLLGSAVSALKNSAGATVAYLAANPNARYIRAGLGVFPNAGRNTIPMPGINNFDLSIGKRFNIREGKSVELRADAANAFNHPQFTPGAVNSVKLTTYSTGDRTYLGPQNSNFQAWNQTFTSNARTMQLAMKVVF